MTCRNEILKCVKEILNQKSNNEFTIQEVIDCMRSKGTKYKESGIRTHVTSRLCSNAPDNHAVTYPDFVRTDRGIYRLNK